MEISSLTINLKVDLPLTRKFLKWSTRKSAVFTCIDSLNPDIIFAQEMSEEISMDMHAHYDKRYTIVQAIRNHKEKNKESLALFLKKSLFKDVTIQTIWLTNTPSITSKLKTSLKPRIATYVQATYRNQKIYFVNTHLDPLFDWVRNRQMAYLTQHLPIENVGILAGDFNGKLNEKWFSHLSKVMHYVKPENSHNTLHYGKGKIKLNVYPIDYMFIKKDLKIIQANIIDHPYNGIYPSDHFPIYLKVGFDA